MEMLQPFDDFIGNLTLLEIGLIGGTVLLAGFLRGFVGFGASLIIVMVLSVALGPVVAVPVAALSGLPAMFQLLPNAVRYSERSFVIPFGLATFVAAPFGTWILVSLEPAIMKMSISLFVLAMVAMLYRGWRLAQHPSPAALFAAGAGAGLVQGAAGVGGPPAVAVALSTAGSAQQQRANVIGTVTALSVCTLLPMWYHGLFTHDVIIASLLIFPLYAGATWLGARFFTQRGQRHFRNAALGALAAIGVVTLALAVRDYGAG
jgi:uncharacterized membrane protein YfcA